ncbi:MAG TPA: hypothetical protein PK821_06120, partial [Victivallales bacterium]|nr:hypothetical protein [Victivallales bacterium]
MIVPMKKVSIICLSHERNSSISELAKLGVLHVSATDLAESEDRASIGKSIETVSRAVAILSSLKGKGKTSATSPDLVKLPSAEKARQIVALSEENSNLAKDLLNLNINIEKLSEWGDFDPENIKALEEKGVYIYFCEKSKNDEFSKPEGSEMHIIRENKNRTLFLILSITAIDPEKLPLSELDMSKSLSQLRSEKKSIEKNIEQNSAKIAEMKIFENEIKIMLKEIKERLSLAEALDSMKSKDSLSCISGYIPGKEYSALKKASERHGWGLLAEDASSDDRFVPTL